MAVTTVDPVPQMFKTSDGRVFENSAAAARHEALAAAAEEYRTARRNLTFQMAKTQTTADGHPFEWSNLTYWRVVTRAERCPDLMSFHLEAHRCRLADHEEDEDGRGDEIEFIHEVYDSRINAYRHSAFRISELYRDEAAAQRTLAVELRKAIGWLEDDAKRAEERGAR